MNQLQVFIFSGNNVRVVTKDGQPWWVAKDVCDLIGLEQVSRAVSRLDFDERDLVKVTHPQNELKTMDVNAVNESGLYQLIIASNKPEAKQFKRWITHEVLPSIRKTGMYAADELLDNPDLLIQAATKLKEERAARKLLEAQALENRPKVLFAEALETSSNTILIGELAKLLRQNGVDIGQNRLFAQLRSTGYLGNKGEYYNMPTQRSMDLELFEIKTRTINNPDGSVRVSKTTKVTGKGQVYFVNQFKKAN